MSVLYCFPQGKLKALTMSYDDGNIADKRLVSIFNQHGIRSTFNLNYGWLCENDPNRVSTSEVADLYKGHEVATHTAHHPNITRCPLPYIANEIMEDRKGLEALTGYIVRGHAYPFGSYSKEIEALLQSLGIAYGRVVADNPSFELPANPMEWKATCHHNNPKLMEYGQSFAERDNRYYLMLMYVWGHSYEFDRNDNWHVIEEFCKLMGHRDDIWYATNIEIIDYIDVLKRLQFNASCTGVYNPSAASAWLNVNNGTIIEAKGGTFTTF